MHKNTLKCITALNVMLAQALDRHGRGLGLETWREEGAHTLGESPVKLLAA